MKRPKMVPADAWWSAEDNEWIQAVRNQNGNLHGLVRYFRPDGTMCCQTEYEEGVPHGSFSRFHETGEVSREGRFERGIQTGLDVSHRATGRTTELCFPHQQVAPSVVRYVQRHEDGLIVFRSFYDTEGRQVFPDGNLIPTRPADVPEDAIPQGPHESGWQLGAVDKKGTRMGLWTFYDAAGHIEEQVRYENGEAVHRLKRVEPDAYDDDRVVFESGPCQGGHWAGDLLLLDAGQQEIKTIDPTGARDVTSPGLKAWLDGLNRIAWQELECAYGAAGPVKRFLATLAGAPSDSARESALEQLWSHLCHQGTTYEASTSAIPLLVDFVLLESDPSWQQRILTLVESMGSMPHFVYQESLEAGCEEVDRAKALGSSVPALVRAFRVTSESGKLAVVRCLAGCFDQPQVIEFLKQQTSADLPVLRGASWAALGNLQALDEATAERMLQHPDLLVRLGVVYGLAIGGVRQPPAGAIETVMDALEKREELKGPFGEFPYADEQFEVECAQMLSQFGQAAANRERVIDALLARLNSVYCLGAAGLVSAALGYVFAEEEEDEEDEEEIGLSESQRRVLQALVDKDDLWELEDGAPIRLVDVLEVFRCFDLPDEREKLRQLLGG